MRRTLLNVTIAFACFATSTAAFAQSIPPVDKRTDHVRGNLRASISVIVYTDFECPFCQRHVATMKKLLAHYRGHVNWVYRPFPLSFHANAQKKAEAAECVAQMKGEAAFWRFHDVLFKRFTAISEDDLGSVAKNLGVNEKIFNECLRTSRYAPHVSEIAKLGTDGGVQGTPANFIVNARTGEIQEISGAVPIEVFIEAIDAMAKRASAAAGAAAASSTPGIGPVRPEIRSRTRLGTPAAIGKPTTPVPPAQPKPALAPVVNRSWDHIRGDLNAPISLVMYGGAEDPFTRWLYPVLQQLLVEYPGVINIVYRHFPLDFHARSTPAAEALECADKLGNNEAFWKFADKLYSQERWDYVTIAKDVGLDGTDFNTCVVLHHRAAELRQHIEGGKNVGVEGTPTSFLINAVTGEQKKIVGAQPIDQFRNAIATMRKTLP